MMEIHYLTYRQIDKPKWDACIDRAPNGLVYAYSYYLDSMAKNWDALVLSAGPSSPTGYEAVMPLTWNKKYGIHYLYQPAFTACLGIFGRNITAEILNRFLLAIPPRFKYWDIYFNPANLFKPVDFALYERMNYVLNLNSAYEDIYGTYRNNIKRNIKKSEKLHQVINKNIALAEVILLVREQTRHFAAMAAGDFDRFKKLYQLLYKKEKSTTYGVYTEAGQLIAAAVFLFSHNRAYYIMAANHPDARTNGSSGRSKMLGASHALINAFIKDHAGQNLLLDFEGSDISSLAFFYSGFGATEEKYSAIHLNKLPAPLKWLKR